MKKLIITLSLLLFVGCDSDEYAAEKKLRLTEIEYEIKNIKLDYLREVLHHRTIIECNRSLAVLDSLIKSEGAE